MSLFKITGTAPTVSIAHNCMLHVKIHNVIIVVLSGGYMRVNIGEPTDSDEERLMEVVIENHDTWNMDTTLARIIIPMLKQLKSTKHGVPGDMPYLNQTSNSAQGSFEFYEEGDDTAFEASSQIWDDVLDKMIFAFEHIVDEEWEQGFQSGTIHFVDVPEYDSAGNVTGYSMKRGENDTYHCDYEGIAAVRLKIQEGLQLFAKHYQSLWD